MTISTGGGSHGVIYVEFGWPYLVMAVHSVMTLQRTNPDLPVCIVTNVQAEKKDIPLLRPEDSLIVVDEQTAMNRNMKTSIHSYSPYERTIFLDCDTVVMGELTTAFRFLDHFDLAFRLNPYPQTRQGKGEVAILDGLTVFDCPHWNSGVVLFRKGPRTEAFFDEWGRTFTELGGGYDQVSLVRTIFRNDAKVLSLDGRWNGIDPILGRRRWRRACRIFHYASNISNKLRMHLIRAEGMIGALRPGNDSDIRAFVHGKRALKYRNLGLLRYLAARLIWLVSSAT